MRRSWMASIETKVPRFETASAIQNRTKDGSIRLRALVESVTGTSLPDDGVPSDRQGLGSGRPHVTGCRTDDLRVAALLEDVGGPPDHPCDAERRREHARLQTGQLHH